jgi:uncharacterized membrane protein (DUF485 family)
MAGHRNALAVPVFSANDGGGMCAVVYDSIRENHSVWWSVVFAAIAFIPLFISYRVYVAVVPQWLQARSMPQAGLVVACIALVVMFIFVPITSHLKREQLSGLVKAGQFDTTQGNVTQHSHYLSGHGSVTVCHKAFPYDDKDSVALIDARNSSIRDGVEARVTSVHGQMVRMEVCNSNTKSAC